MATLEHPDCTYSHRAYAFNSSTRSIRHAPAFRYARPQTRNRIKNARTNARTNEALCFTCGISKTCGYKWHVFRSVLTSAMSYMSNDNVSRQNKEACLYRPRHNIPLQCLAGPGSDYIPIGSHQTRHTTQTHHTDTRKYTHTKTHPQTHIHTHKSPKVTAGKKFSISCIFESVTSTIFQMTTCHKSSGRTKVKRKGKRQRRTSRGG